MDAVQFQDKAALLRPRLLNIALRYLHQKEEAEDVVQDTLLRVWQLDLATAADVERLSGVVVKNLCIDLLRRRRVKVSLEGVDIAALLHISPSAVRQTVSRARLSILKHYHSAE